MRLSPSPFNDIFDHVDLMGPRGDGKSGGPQHDVQVPCFDSMWPALDNSLSPPVFNFGINATPSINQALNHTTDMQPFSQNHLWDSDCDLLTIDHNFGSLTNIGYATSAEPTHPTPNIIGGQHSITQVLGGIHSLQE